jgi:NADPH-dependent 7-cyano-7-deazaguanine reductase QueF
MPEYEGTETRYYVSDATLLRVVPAETTGEIRHEVRGVDAECPYESFHDVYDVAVAYRPADHVAEIASLRAYADQFADVELSHEAFCETVFADLRGRLAPLSLSVVAECNEYHGVVTTVTRSTDGVAGG